MGLVLKIWNLLLVIKKVKLKYFSVFRLNFLKFHHRFADYFLWILFLICESAVLFQFYFSDKKFAKPNLRTERLYSYLEFLFKL